MEAANGRMRGGSWRFGLQGEGRKGGCDGCNGSWMSTMATPSPPFYSITFSSLSFSFFPFSFFYFLSSDNGFSSFIRNSGIPEFIPEVCWRNNNSDHVAIIIFTVFFLFLLLLFGENVTQSLRRMWIGSGGYVMKTEPRATDKNEAIFSIADVNPNLQANNF